MTICDHIDRTLCMFTEEEKNEILEGLRTPSQCYLTSSLFKVKLVFYRKLFEFSDEGNFDWSPDETYGPAWINLAGLKISPLEVKPKTKLEPLYVKLRNRVT